MANKKIQIKDNSGNNLFPATDLASAGNINVLPIARGGTGATSADEIRTNLSLASKSDLSKLLDKGTSSSVVNQIVYNPVEMKKALTVPSIQSANSANNPSNGAPLYKLGGTMATESGQATGSASLSLLGYTGASGTPYDTILTQTASGIFEIAPGARPSDPLIWADGWKIHDSPILTESSISTQQWTLTDTNGDTITVNICVK